MRRQITGVRLGGDGFGVAELDCHRPQRRAHRPTLEAGALSKDERTEKPRPEVLDCVAGDRAELLDGLVGARVAPPLTRASLPSALR